VHRYWFQFLAAAGLLLASACRSVDSKVRIDRGLSDCDAPLRVLIMEQKVAEVDWTGRGEWGTLTAKQKAIVDRMMKQYARGPQDVPTVPAGNSSLSLQMLTPDGWMARPVRLNADPYLRPGEYSVSPIEFPGEPADYAYYPPTVTFLLDNRNCPKSELAYGQLAVTVAENEAKEIRAPLAQLPDNTGVRLNGQSIGSIDLPLRTHTYLIDCSGRRSYRRQDVSYGLTGYGSHAPPEQFRGGKHLYAVLGRADYFITPAPQKMMVQGMPVASSSELVEETTK